MHRSKMRNVLVVFQFAASITLVISLFAILRQMEFIRTKDVGFQRDQIVTFKINGTDDDTRMPIFKERLLQHQNVLGASLSTSLPHNVNSSTGLTGIDDNGNQLTVRSYQAYADEQFLDLYGIPIISGEGLRRDDMKSYVVNEAFVKHFGWKDPIGKTLLRGDMQVQVVGVLRDFNAHSLYQPMEPLFLSWADFKWTSNLSVKIRPVDIPGTLNFFQRTWQELYPERPFQYAFLDDEFNLVYIDEERFSEVITYSAVLAITVALLGLFGLAAFIIEQRKKEIGVRKILGASLGAIVLTLSKEFMLLVGIANVLAWPIGYYFMSKWLENFAFRVDLGVGIFLLAAAGALVTAFLTVSIQSMRAASSNPIEALRYE